MLCVQVVSGPMSRKASIKSSTTVTNWANINLTQLEAPQPSVALYIHTAHVSSPFILLCSNV